MDFFGAYLFHDIRSIRSTTEASTLPGPALFIAAVVRYTEEDYGEVEQSCDFEGEQQGKEDSSMRIVSPPSLRCKRAVANLRSN